MSSQPRQAGALFPPIEVGSFVSRRPDKSEFIGSASGVFFINTVFRAFAASSSSPAAAAAAAAARDDPGSLPATHEQQPGDGDDLLLGLISDDASTGAATPSGPHYGIGVPGLGAPPTPAAAKELLMIYFRKWHPVFPFLHGPTFFEEVHRFYSATIPGGGGGGGGETLRDKLCRALRFQCVFNIAATDADDQLSEPRCRITSPALLTGLLGLVVAGDQDVRALQTLLAMELYLVTRMSSRAASTVHGALTRLMYQAGLHRCPFRYRQLPRGDDALGVRQRVWWCAYVLDRHLGLALGHPVAVSDDEVDVCVPGGPELHGPVEAGDEARAHLPATRESFLRNNGLAPAGGSDGRDHDTRRPEEAPGLVLGCMVTYSQLLGDALRLFHTSIHKRSIALDKVLDLTARIHSWWNSLPSSLQDDEDATGAKSPHAAFFAVLYHHLVLCVSRPFLSLPTDREDFGSCLQSALSASRAIIRQLRASAKGSLVLAWPGALSAVWMAGLVVAYASLLKLYPLEKGILDMNHSISLLEGMGRTWTSASHCRDTLKLMLDQLASQTRVPNSPSQAGQIPSEEALGSEGLGSEGSPDAAGESRSKRRRHDQAATPSPHPGTDPVLASGMASSQIWQPVLEYTGPDFGFDANQFCRQDAWQEFLVQGLNPGLSGLLFDDAGWDSYVKTFGDRLS
ncbi:Transcription factor [Cordyceps fumosorosea ARSEF 2679]|uniref:Transcription factor n=1 Tax=Cordyceps fumosorosea (strain ARSEF 2679) TaxID=1081104 RepID=A0A167Q450_CORFA|nr:Transcription factor [Cordyceps fumosorosea ARSEF 2679]OAA57265.1 Transcription factor [Cordyceps fumosorosea ARSEF 2679]